MLDFQRLEREIEERGMVRELDNGVILFGEHIPNLSLTKGCLFLHGGSYVEDEKDLGAMHFLEHMIGESSKQYPASQKMALSTRLGLKLDASTSGTLLNFPVSGSNPSSFLLNQNFLAALHIILDAVYHPLHLLED